MHDDLLANKLGALWAVLGEGFTQGFGTLAESTAAVLLALHHRGPMGVTALAHLVGLSQPACTRLLDRLVATRQVTRTKGEGREVLVAVTAAGRRRAEALQRRRLDFARDLLAGLSRAERAALDRLLDRLVAQPVRDRAHARHLCRFCDHGVCTRAVCPIGAAATAIEEREKAHAD
jgi:DNA-binding MarR family transcriptional regulator